MSKEDTPKTGLTNQNHYTSLTTPKQPDAPPKKIKVRRRAGAKKCPVHTTHDVLFHCHACKVDICKLCWKLGHTGALEAHHNVVHREFEKQKSFVQNLDNFNVDDRLAEIDNQSKLCEKTYTQLKNLIDKLQQEKSVLQNEVVVCDKLISHFGKLQAMARMGDFDHTNEEVLQFMALKDNPYDSRDPILSENDKNALEGLIEEIDGLVLQESPESSVADSIPPCNDTEENKQE